MKTTASDIRPGDFLWATPASESIRVAGVRRVGEYVEVSGTTSSDDLLWGKGRRRYFAAMDSVNIRR